MIHSLTELHQRRFYVTNVLFVSSTLSGNLPENGMNEVCVNVFFVQRGPDCELDFASMFLLASFVVPEPAVAFSIFMSHLMPLFTVVFGIRQTE
jgi:hypothetical protein